MNNFTPEYRALLELREQIARTERELQEMKDREDKAFFAWATSRKWVNSLPESVSMG